MVEPKNFMDRWSDVINRRRIAREEIEDPRDAEIARLRTVLRRQAEGWRNAIELGLIPANHVNSASILAAEAEEASKPTE